MTAVFYSLFLYTFRNIGYDVMDIIDVKFPTVLEENRTIFMSFLNKDCCDSNRTFLMYFEWILYNLFFTYL